MRSVTNLTKRLHEAKSRPFPERSVHAKHTIRSNRAAKSQQSSNIGTNFDVSLTIAHYPHNIPLVPLTTYAPMDFTDSRTIFLTATSSDNYLVLRQR